MRRWFPRHPSCTLAATGLLLSLSQLASADPAATLKSSAEQLAAGQIEAVITSLERAADEGQHHPDLSFNRGLGYLRRLGTAAERPGDLGQAAAAFAETLAQRPADAEAARGLEETQLQVARRNSRGKHKEVTQVGASLGLLERALLSMSPAALFWLSAGASLVMLLGSLLRFALSETRRLVGTIALSVGALLLVPGTAAYFARDGLFRDAKLAVVISAQAELVDESGRRVTGQPPLAESTLVYVRGPERGLLRLVSLGTPQYVSMSQVRVVSHAAL